MSTYNRFAHTLVASLLGACSAHAAICPGNLGPSSTPTSNFTINSNGTVVDATTGLMWKRCNEGLSGETCTTGSATYEQWNGAMSFAKASTFAGYNDWRLPNIKELESLLEYTCTSPSINESVFPNTAKYYSWSSTSFENSGNIGGDVWTVNFDKGWVGLWDKGYPFDVFILQSFAATRLVRGGFDVIPLAPQTLTFEATPVGVTVGTTARVKATSAAPNSGNPIEYWSQTPETCVVAYYTGEVNALGVGVCTVAVQQAGNTYGYLDTAVLSQSFFIGKVTEAAPPVPVPGPGRWLIALFILLLAAVSLRKRLSS